MSNDINHTLHVYDDTNNNKLKYDHWVKVKLSLIFIS